MLEVRKNPNSSHSCVILVRVGFMFVLIWIWVYVILVLRENLTLPYLDNLLLNWCCIAFGWFCWLVGS